MTAVTDLLGLEKVLCISYEHFLYTGIQYNGRQRPLVTGVGVTPRAIRVGKVDLDPVDGLRLVLLFRL